MKDENTEKKLNNHLFNQWLYKAKNLISFDDIKTIALSSVVIGAIYQVISLQNIWMLQFFSWSQVINDTAIFLVPTIFLIIFFNWWTSISQLLYDKLIEHKHKIPFGVKLLIITLAFCVLLLIYFRLNKYFVNMWYELIKSVMFYTYFIINGFLIWLIWWFFIKKSEQCSSYFYIIFIFLFVWLSATIWLLNSVLYDELYIVKQTTEKESIIEYMNDKYIFTKEDGGINTIQVQKDITIYKKIEKEDSVALTTNTGDYKYQNITWLDNLLCNPLIYTQLYYKTITQ